MPRKPGAGESLHRPVLRMPQRKRMEAGELQPPGRRRDPLRRLPCRAAAGQPLQWPVLAVPLAGESLVPGQLTATRAQAWTVEAATPVGRRRITSPRSAPHVTPQAPGSPRPSATRPQARPTAPVVMPRSGRPTTSVASARMPHDGRARGFLPSSRTRETTWTVGAVTRVVPRRITSPHSALHATTRTPGGLRPSATRRRARR